MCWAGFSNTVGVTQYCDFFFLIPVDFSTKVKTSQRSLTTSHWNFICCHVVGSLLKIWKSQKNKELVSRTRGKAVTSSRVTLSRYSIMKLLLRGVVHARTCSHSCISQLNHHTDSRLSSRTWLSWSILSFQFLSPHLSRRLLLKLIIRNVNAEKSIHADWLACKLMIFFSALIFMQKQTECFTIMCPSRKKVPWRNVTTVQAKIVLSWNIMRFVFLSVKIKYGVSIGSWNYDGRLHQLVRSDVLVRNVFSSCDAVIVSSCCHPTTWLYLPTVSMKRTLLVVLTRHAEQ